MSIEKKCGTCGKTIFVKPCLAERTKFCSRACMNQAKKGKRFSLKTEFKKGITSPKRCPVGTIRTRKRNRGKRRFSKWIKIENPNKWILFCHCVWEKHCGAIPRGFLVHHKDRNTLNNNIANLELMSRAKHLLEHRPEFEKKRFENLRLISKK